MRTAYAMSATITAVQLMPTQITARQATCMATNGMMRLHSMVSAAGSSVATGLSARLLLSSQFGRRNFTRCLSLVVQCRNALFERRMAHEQPLEALTCATLDPEGGKLRRQRFVGGHFQALERGNHVARARHAGTAAISTEFAL